MPNDVTDSVTGRHESDLSKLIAEAICEAFEAKESDAEFGSGSYVLRGDDLSEPTRLDGRFYLTAVAKNVERRLRSAGVLAQD